MRDPRAFFEANLELIDRISAAVCRRGGCRGEDAEDFASLVRVKLLEDDCARLRKFRGRSKVETFLTLVITNLFRDHRNQQWGKWRPSTMARTLGREAMLLERLTTRDQRSVDEAVEILVTNYRVTASRQDLWAMWRQLPEKAKRRFVPVEETQEIVAATDTGSRALKAEGEALRRRLSHALGRALQALQEEDRLLLRLCFEDALSVATIARSLGMNQRQLYYRREVALEGLRATLEADGFNARDVLGTLGRTGWESGGGKIIFESVYSDGGSRASEKEDAVDREHPPRPRKPRGLRRGKAPGSREERGRGAPGCL